MATLFPEFELDVPDDSAKKSTQARVNQLKPQDRSVHDWYRFVLSFPPHLVRDTLLLLEAHKGEVVLDPFCGTGTTLVECKKAQQVSFGLEANAMALLAAQVKVDWSPDPDLLWEHSQFIARQALDRLASDGVEDDPLLYNPTAREREGRLRALPDEAQGLLLTNSISALPLHKSLVLRDAILQWPDPWLSAHQRLAMAKTLVFHASNLHFGPEVGVRAPKVDAPVVSVWLSLMRQMCDDLRQWQGQARTPTRVIRGDAREPSQVLGADSVDIVITSPPYPNEKDYTRTTRLESVILGLVSTKAELRTLKKGLLRSNTRGVYREDGDDAWIADFPQIERIAAAIEQERVRLNKTSGFEKLYPRVTKLYFGGMARHLAEMRSVLRPGARLAYVVGDQASFLRVMIRTGHILCDIAHKLGYEVVGIELFRTRLSTATKEQLREEIVLLRWRG